MPGRRVEGLAELRRRSLEDWLGMRARDGDAFLIGDGGLVVGYSWGVGSCDCTCLGIPCILGELLIYFCAINVAYT